MVAYSGQFKEELLLVCDDWLDYAERHQIEEFMQSVCEAREGYDCAISAFSTRVATRRQQALTADQVRAAARLVAAIHRDLQSETSKRISAS